MHLLQATPEMSRDRDRASYEAWGGELLLERYLAEAWRLRSHAWPEAAQAIWFLCAEDGEVLSSCETYRMTSFLGEGPGGAGNTYGVGSVYTEPGKRRQGHAVELLSRLALRLGQEDPVAQAMILYSDVPLAIYEKAGFIPRPGLNLVFDALRGDPAEGVEELLTEDRAPGALAGIPRRPGAFTVWPVAEQIDWHLERERIFSELMGRSRPAACGARIGGATALWCADYREGQLTMLLWHAPSRAGAEALLACARRVAGAAGLAKTVLWRTPEDGPWAQATLDDRGLRLDSVPMIRPLDPRVRTGDWDWIPRALWV